MFCFQCEQASKGTGCTIEGTCGKSPGLAAHFDVLMHTVKGLSMYAHRARQLGASDHEIDVFTLKAIFITVTNVNFDPAVAREYIVQAVELRQKAKELYEGACSKAGQTPESLSGPATWTPAQDADGIVAQGEETGISNRAAMAGEDVTGLQELILYGLKGLVAYADHAQVLGAEDEGLYAFTHEVLDYLTQTPAGADELLGWALKVGEQNLKCMELLDSAHTNRYGHPEPTQVRIEPVKGKAIAVSGHDLRDLEEILKQTEGKGVNVYTHGELLPANAYPELKKYPHFVGNYGGPWQVQQREFRAFPGAVFMTTNCLVEPHREYSDRLFTGGVVGWPGIKHIKDRDFTPLIEAALAAEGFTEDGPDKTITVGFGHNAVLGVADKVIDAVKEGAIRHFFLIGGCDGARAGRNYYLDLAESVPDDCVILTLACGKYRFNKLDFGDIGGIPRLLDVGQCNDAYSAIKIASALADAFGTDVNSLPLSLVISWFEQKAVAILLTLLHLGIKNIRLGPTLPAFVTPAVLNVLVENYNVMPISTPEEDLQAILGTDAA